MFIIQLEYELLTTKIFPELHRICVERGTYFRPVDLQWEPSDKLAQRGNLLTSAFRYIERCAPFFMALVGDRYGEHRDPDNDAPLRHNDVSDDWLERNLLSAAACGHDWVLEEHAQYESVTHLQVLHGAFRDCARHHACYEEAESQCFFYYRQPEFTDGLYAHLEASERTRRLQEDYRAESEYADYKCRNMKADIIKRGHGVKYYQSLEELGGFVLNDWRYVIDQFCPPIYQALNITSTKGKT